MQKGFANNSLSLNVLQKRTFDHAKRAVLHSETARFTLPKGPYCSMKTGRATYSIAFVKFPEQMRRKIPRNYALAF